MNQKALKTLEYNKIIEMLEAKCLTPIGRNEAKHLVPLQDLHDIQVAQQETEDALSRIYRFGAFSASGARDVRDSLARLRIQANLSMSELLSIGTLQKTAFRVKQYGLTHEAESL